MKKPVTLRSIQPNAGIRAMYRKRLDTLVCQMHKSVLYWLTCSYKNNTPEIIGDELPTSIDGPPPPVVDAHCGDDASSQKYGSSSPIISFDAALPANAMKRSLNKLGSRWNKRFKDKSKPLAEKMTKDVARYTDNAFKKSLRDKGVAIKKLPMTLAQRDILRATVEQNTQLIKSVSNEYLARVQGSVMRAIQTGRDLQHLTNELESTLKIARNRAALIARDQTSKATASLNRSRQLQLGIEEAIWMHSGAGKHKRPTHVKKSGGKFNIRTGWLDPAVGHHIWPGTEIECKCYSKPIIPGL